MYKSCELVKHGLCFFDGSLAICCHSPADQINGQTPPFIRDTYNGEIVPKEELFQAMDKYADIFKKGGCPAVCANCFKIEEKEWDEEKYINQITIAHFTKCNADCIYCANNLAPHERKQNAYKIYPILKNYIDNGIIKKGCEFHISGGEFSIYEEADDLLDLLAISGFAKVIIATNAIKYSDKLFKALNAGNTFVCVSLDCGSRKLFKKIKRIDAFDKVIENLEKYATTETSKNAMHLKYIIIPSINDNIKEFNEFLKIAKKIGIKNIIIDLEGRYSRYTNNKIDSYFIDIALKMEEIAKEQNFNTELYQFFAHNTTNKKIKRNHFIINFIKSIKFKYFSKDIKELYKHHNYGSKLNK